MSLLGSSRGFAFLVTETAPGWGTLQLQLSVAREPGGSTGQLLGHGDRPTDLNLRASWLEAALETHLSGWPPELAGLTDPLQSFHFLRALYSEGEESASRVYAVDPRVFAEPELALSLKTFVLTNALGEPLDGIFAAVRPSPRGLWLAWDDRTGAGARLQEVAAAEYRAAVHALFSLYGTEECAARFRRAKPPRAGPLRL